MRLARVLHRRPPEIAPAADQQVFTKAPLRSLLGSRLRSAVTLAALTAVATLSTGCDIRSFIDPSEMFSSTKRTVQRPILGTISSIDPGIDDPEDTFYQATEVKPSDLLAVSQDYRIGKGDLVNISVTDLVGIGVETTKQARVSESGNISMPLLGQVHAEGLTEIELESAIVAAYRNGQIITNAQVSVQVVEARARTFSALGAVQSPGQYAILKSDFRLLDALVLTRDVVQSVDTVYVIRQVSEDPKPGDVPGGAAPQPAAPGGTPPPVPAGPDPLAPPAHGVISLDTVGATTSPPAPAPTPTTAPSSGFTFNAPTPPAESRTIKIPLDALRNGDLRYNIVIRPQDLIIAPNPVVGEYYMGGHVTRGGVYSLAARRITLKQAVVSAGMLDPLAIPQRTELIRRIGSSREAFVRVDLNAIFDGTQPDIFLKPYDVVQVGTNCLAPFIQDLRTGFRITYGFGFLYDRNFAPQQQTN